MIIDDYVPVDSSGNIVFTRCHGNEIWVVLLEKAWAKIHGGFNIIYGGFGKPTFRDITGAPAYDYELKKEENLWEII